jgi:hypothetical protein
MRGSFGLDGLKLPFVLWSLLGNESVKRRIRFPFWWTVLVMGWSEENERM